MVRLTLGRWGCRGVYSSYHGGGGREDGEEGEEEVGEGKEGVPLTLRITGICWPSSISISISDLPDRFCSSLTVEASLSHHTLMSLSSQWDMSDAWLFTLALYSELYSELYSLMLSHPSSCPPISDQSQSAPPSGKGLNSFPGAGRPCS